MSPARKRAWPRWEILLLLLVAAVLIVRSRRRAHDPPSGFPSYLNYLLDADDDRLLTREEFGLDTDLEAEFELIDANADGLASVIELREHYRVHHLPEILARMYKSPLAELEEVPALALSDQQRWSNAPALAVSPGGVEWTLYVSHEKDVGDKLLIQRRGVDGSSETMEVTPEAGQYVRPVVACSGEDVFCTWTRTEPADVSSIWFRRLHEGVWSPPERLLPGESRAHQNPEITAGPDGEVSIAYQLHAAGRYAIHLVRFSAGQWTRPVALGDPAANDWDPTLAYDSRGRLHVAWSAYVDGDYDVHHVRLDGGPAAALPEPRRVSTRGPYDLHPWLTAGPEGAVWLTWDRIRVVNHMSSGKTTITGANLAHEQPGSNFQKGASTLAVRLIDDDVVRAVASPEAPEGYLISHSGLPKMAAGPGGEPWIVYRALRAGDNPWDPREGIGFYWDLLAHALQGDAWSEALRLADSDGYLEEAGVAAGRDGLHVVYGGERRRDSMVRVARARRKRAEDADDWNHHGDYDGFAGCNGEVYLASLGSADASGPALSVFDVAVQEDEDDLLERRRAPRYEVQHAGETYRLLWGDTHRHSNVSRCSRGMEPSPEDQYRYGMDLSRLDYFALSDHAEHLRLTGFDTGYYYWWLQHKLADLYHVPGSLSVLYTLEWTLRFPHGHHNVIFPDRSTVFLARNVAESDTLVKGWEVLESAGARAITIPHTGADLQMGTTWEDHDPRFERLCEVFQAATGSYEHEGCPRQFHNAENDRGFYWDALEKGYHIGAIASSDHGFGQAYACVYALENTREAIWQAMWDRRVYGSTTYGLVLDVRSGQHWMGEVWSSKEAPTLSIRIAGSAPLRSVEVIGRSSVLWSRGSVEEPLGTLSFDVDWQDPDWDGQTAEQWYYVRVIQVDDEMAWSSPVWVQPERP